MLRDSDTRLQEESVPSQHMRNRELAWYIERMKHEKNAVILVHNYQRPEIYRIADFIGDSLELSRKAAETDCERIVFCGVRFMAETAKILSPDKTVLLPNLSAGCSLSDMATAEQVNEARRAHPHAAVVAYVNSSAEVKAVADICCTSANAVAVVNGLPQDEIIFLPDRNLARYVQTMTHKKIYAWDGFCAVHQELSADSLLAYKHAHPGTKIIAHPECRADILRAADHISSTGGMARYAQEDDGKDYMVVTECGMVNKLREDVPSKSFVSFCNFCSFMKSTSLEMVAQALCCDMHQINLPEDLMCEARRSLTRMLEIA